MSYNGWKNYETWCVSMWLDNDEGTYLEVRDLADAETDAYELAQTLKVYVDDLAEMTCPGCREGASFVADLLGAALSEVAWDDIAQHYIDEQEGA